jgi:hypothetical protein
MVVESPFCMPSRCGGSVMLSRGFAVRTAVVTVEERRSGGRLVHAREMQGLFRV